MTWFKVDDGWHKHRKRIRAGLDLEGFAARGLWVDAGSWASDELTDGFVPDDVLEYLAPGIGERLAKRLEAARLWYRAERDGEEGWQYHDWTDQQPTKEEVEAALSRKSTGGKLGNHRRWHAEQGKFDAKCPYCRTGGDRLTDRTSDRSTDGTSDRSSESGASRPSRPVPTRPVQDLPPEDLFGTATAPPGGKAKSPARRAAKDATPIPDDFAVTDDMKAWAKEKARLVNWPTETENFIDYWRAKPRDNTKRDWVATWRTWMRNANERLAERGVNRAWEPSNDHQGRAAPKHNGAGYRSNKHTPFMNPTDENAYEGTL